ncbi:hypothetical protein U8Q79_15615 [Klebsiella pneumoniae]|nr:hypothetical protein [Klebsiella pneumoniae]WQN87249.1 hypothetical protein U8Q79_15615 [Klebsiella pneumoniae]WQN92847.1 hypothetical protein U8Q78_15610 [Klebsiella pneumoniae]
MNEETNYRQLWRNLVICCVLCLLMFWFPLGCLIVRQLREMWPAL